MFMFVTWFALQVISTAVHEDGYELSLTVNFALRGNKDPFVGERMGYSKREFLSTMARKGSLNSYGSQDSLGDYKHKWHANAKPVFSLAFLHQSFLQFCMFLCAIDHCHTFNVFWFKGPFLFSWTISWIYYEHLAIARTCGQRSFYSMICKIFFVYIAHFNTLSLFSKSNYRRPFYGCSSNSGIITTNTPNHD